VELPQKKLYELEDWPQELIDLFEKPGFFTKAKELLRVKNADEIKNDLYGGLQNFFAKQC